MDEGKIYKLPYQKKHNFRKIDSNPFKVLDAGHLQDDFYINVIDWSRSNNLAVGLGNTLYVWNFVTNDIKRLTGVNAKKNSLFPYEIPTIPQKWNNHIINTEILEVVLLGIKKFIYYLLIVIQFWQITNIMEFLHPDEHYRHKNIDLIFY